MSRLPRIVIPGFSTHVTKRGNGRMAIFREDADRQMFLRILELGVRDYTVLLHGFVLMVNHYHLLLTATDVNQLSKSMASLAWRYATYFSVKYQRTGTLWESRYFSKLVDTEEYLLRCLRYIEQNPVRAHVASSPAEYPWSSYRCHGDGQPIEFLTPHAVYLGLSNSVSDRAAAYRVMCGAVLTDEELMAVRIPQ